MQRNVLALILLTTACTSAVEPDATPRGDRPLYAVEVGSHDLSGTDLRGAVLWRELSEELEACLAGATDFYGVDQCTQVAPTTGWSYDSVELGGFTDGFVLPVYTIPGEEVTADEATGRLGVGFVTVFEDHNGNGALDIVPPGTAAPIDNIVGTSIPDGPAYSADYIVYREGGLSPVWKMFSMSWGCAEPAPGFSVVRLQATEEGADCSVLPEAPLFVHPVTEPDTQLLMCQWPDLEEFTYPDAPPTAATLQCYGAETVLYDLAPGAFCADYRRVDLVGCSDLSSEEACYASFWDLRGNPPSWWPCPDTGRELVLENTGTLTDQPGDHLFDIRYVAGHSVVEASGLSLEVSTDTDNAVVLRAGFGLELVDENDDGLFSAGDALRVSEPGVEELWGTDIPPGRYAVHLHAEVFGESSRWLSTQWEPIALPPEGTDIQIVIFDGTPSEDGIVMEVFYEYAVDPSAPVDQRHLPVDEISVSLTDHFHYLSVICDVSGCLELVDRDADGTFSQGDGLLIRLSAEEVENRPEWDEFGTGGYATVSVRRNRGPGWVEQLAWEEVSSF